MGGAFSVDHGLDQPGADRGKAGEASRERVGDSAAFAVEFSRTTWGMTNSPPLATAAIIRTTCSGVAVNRPCPTAIICVSAIRQRDASPLAGRLGRWHTAAGLAGQVDARPLSKAQLPGPIGQGLRRQFFGVTEEIDVAAFRQGVGQRDVAVAGTVTNVLGEALAIGMLEVSAAKEFRRRVESRRFQQGDGRDRLEDRAGR